MKHFDVESLNRSLAALPGWTIEDGIAVCRPNGTIGHPSFESAEEQIAALKATIEELEIQVTVLEERDEGHKEERYHLQIRLDTQAANIESLAKERTELLTKIAAYELTPYEITAAVEPAKRTAKARKSKKA